MNMLDPEIRDDLLARTRAMGANADIPTRDQIERYSKIFAERFGPDRLASLDGEDLLEAMHGREGRDSLAYWLEFKNDDEFPQYFGSIAGGSALKFGVYQRQSDGAWVTGTPRDLRTISKAEAIDIARRQRDELAIVSRILEDFAVGDSSDERFAELQNAIDAAAPNLSNVTWSHKYWFILHPDKIDGYHTANYQRFHLIKLKQLPPDGLGTIETGRRPGRFICAGRYIAIARDIHMPLVALTFILNQRNGPFHRYWRIGTRAGDTREDFWPQMHENGHCAIGWAKLGDLSFVLSEREARAMLRHRFARQYPNVRQVITRKANEVFDFVDRMQEGDLVVACDGMTVRGVGRITGEYQYDSSSVFPNLRPMIWLNVDEWSLPERDGLLTTVFQLGRHAVNLVAIEEKIASGSITHRAPGDRIIRRSPAITPELPALPPIAGRIKLILDRKGQVIVYGPPGTGKTHWALSTARELAAREAYGKVFAELGEREKAEICDESTEALVQVCSFHPAYGYEDFIEGYRPGVASGNLVFHPRVGLFRSLCDVAMDRPGRNFYLVLDEINRGDIPRIFGELMTVLELDKRGQLIRLPLTGATLQVPRNLYIIGTMNTADRSISLLDAALRRRFGFVELMPDADVLGDSMLRGVPLGAWLDALNRRICLHLGRDARNLQIGHAYFLDNGHPLTSFQRFARVLHEDIIPLLEEYCYEDYRTLEQILGKPLIDVERMRVREELFLPEREAELAEIISTLYPETATSPLTIDAEQAGEEETQDVDGQENAANDGTSEEA